MGAIWEFTRSFANPGTSHGSFPRKVECTSERALFPGRVTLLRESIAAPRLKTKPRTVLRSQVLRSQSPTLVGPDSECRARPRETARGASRHYLRRCPGLLEHPLTSNNTREGFGSRFRMSGV